MTPLTPVVVGLSGGLGNQMFQYATARSLALRLQVPLLLDLDWFAGRPERQYALAPFAIAGKPAAKLPLPAVLRRNLARWSRKRASRRMGVPVMRERHFHFDPELMQVKSPVYLEGYWQSERYFADHSEAIRSEFSLVAPVPARCLEVLEGMARVDPVCVHVRRGDYVTDPRAAAYHSLCSPEYYRKAVATLAEGLRQPVAFVFSDEPQWVADHMQLPVPMSIVDVNGPGDAHLDLQLMASCTHFVIANSSLSWWGAWLGRNAGKRVIAPRQWFRDDARDTSDLLPPGWLRL